MDYSVAQCSQAKASKQGIPSDVTPAILRPALHTRGEVGTRGVTTTMRRENKSSCVSGLSYHPSSALRKVSLGFPLFLREARVDSG